MNNNTLFKHLYYNIKGLNNQDFIWKGMGKMTAEKLKQYRHLVKEYADEDNEQSKKRIRAEIAEIEDFIENLEGDEIKRIFKLRYIYCSEINARFLNPDSFCQGYLL